VTERFESAVDGAVVALGSAGLRHLAAIIATGKPLHDLTDAALESAHAVTAAMADDAVPPDQAAAYLRGVATGCDHRAARVRTELVWTGPTVFDVPVRNTAQVLAALVNEARRELILTTYSARPHAALLTALQAAVTRGVCIWIVVETLHGAGSALQGEQPAAAFDGLLGVTLWTWAVDRRADGAKMHAKLAVVDQTALLVTSANLTASGISNNIEAGVLIRGGESPRRAAEHLHALRREAHLIRL
jgi:phosphatidylserine/phosphatidylglycerophosphate/cardiolipin synthase-like enzyme